MALSKAERQARYRQKHKALGNLASTGLVEEYRRVRLGIIQDWLDNPDDAGMDIIEDIKAEIEGETNEGKLCSWFEDVVLQELEKEIYQHRKQRDKEQARMRRA